MRGVVGLVVVLVALGVVVNGQLPEIASTIYRVSPYGDCGSAADQFRTALMPCMNPNPYTFQSMVSNNSQFYNQTLPPIASIIALPFGLRDRNLYIGNTNNRIQVMQPSVGNVTLNTQGNVIQTFTPKIKDNTGNYINVVSDNSTYVAFLNLAGTLAKFALIGDGSLDANSNITLATGAGPVKSFINRYPNLIIAGGPSGAQNIVVVNVATNSIVSTTAIPASVLPVGNLVTCGAANADGSIVYYSASGGIIFSFDTVNLNFTESISTGLSFSGLCTSKGNNYALFVTNGPASVQNAPISIYQYDFPTLTTAQYAVSGIGSPGQYPGPGTLNADQTAWYFTTFVPGGQNVYLVNIYEFTLYSETFDFTAIIQDVEQFGDKRNFLDPSAISTLYGNSIYIAATGTVPRIYELLVPTTSPALARNATIRYNLVPDFTLAGNPNGPLGKGNNSIGDNGQTVTNGDLVVGNGLGSYKGSTNATTIPPTGAIVTYLRGTATEARLGAANFNGINFKLVSLDEVTATGTGNSSTINLLRSIPFFSSDAAPWGRPREVQPLVGYGQTWSLGLTDTISLSSRNYNYFLPPYPVVVNNTNPTQPQPTQAKKRSTTFNEGALGLMGMTVEQIFYGQNDTMDTILGTPYNISSRFFRYRFNISNFPFSTFNPSSFLRLTMAIGLGLDGNTSLGTTILGSNSTTPPLIPGYIILTETADWTLLLPQKSQVNGAVRNAPYNCTYDPQTSLLSLYLNRGVTNSSLSYQFLTEYSYVAPPPVLPSYQDGGGPKLLPLWIVIGVVGCVLIIAVIVVIVVIIVLYKVAGDRIKAFIMDRELHKTTNALGEKDSNF